MDDFSLWKEVFKGHEDIYDFFAGVEIDLVMVRNICKNQQYGIVVIDTHGDKKYGIRLSPIDPNLTKPPSDMLKSYHWLNRQTIPSLDIKNTIVITLGCNTASLAHLFLESGALAVFAADGSPCADEIYKIGALISYHVIILKMELTEALEMSHNIFERKKYNCFKVFT
jgi:hypothetical protein